MTIDFSGFNLTKKTGSSGGVTNHAQLTNLDYANAGHTGFMSDANYLPAGTVINVKLDGSGDFTTVEDALDYIIGKWSNGVVTIQLGAGTFTGSGALNISSSQFNFSGLILKGSGRAETIISRTSIGSYVAGLYVRDFGYVQIEDLTLQIDNSSTGFCLNTSTNSIVRLSNINAAGGNTAYHTSSTISLRGTSIYATNVTTCIQAQNGTVEISNTVLNFSSATTGINCIDGSIIRISNNSSKSFTNVTNTFNTATNTPSGNGIIITSLS